MPLLRRPHAHHREVRARLTPALPSINANRRHQDRHLMTTIAASPLSSTALLSRWSSTGHEYAQLNMPFTNQREPSTAISSLPLDHQLALLRVSHTINHVQAHCTRLRI